MLTVRVDLQRMRKALPERRPQSCHNRSTLSLVPIVPYQCRTGSLFVKHFGKRIRNCRRARIVNDDQWYPQFNQPM